MAGPSSIPVRPAGLVGTQANAMDTIAAIEDVLHKLIDAWPR
jgi:hypothetical protein